MAKPGTKPKPTALKVLEGNPGKRPLNENEPKLEPKAPVCPKWLDNYAHKVWERLAPVLKQMGLLTFADRETFACYCQSVSDYRRAMQIIEKEGVTTATNTGYVSKHPAVTMKNEALKNIKSLASEFGLTPSSRSGLVVPGSDDDDFLD